MNENQNQGYGVQPNVAPQTTTPGYGAPAAPVAETAPAAPAAGYGSAPTPAAPAGEKKPLDWKIIAIIAAIAVIVIVIIIILTTGGKTLTCTGEQFGIPMEAEYKFKGDKASSAETRMVFNYEDLDVTKSEAETQLKSMGDLYEGQGIKVSYDIGDKEAKLVMSIDTNSEEFKEYDGKSYDEVKKEMEDSGFTCK